MVDEQKQNNESFGEYLKRQREIRGFSLEEIAEQTKISLRALKALEAEDWEILPAEIYVRGFIRCYCETIGLDPNEAILRFEQVYKPHRLQEPSLSEKDRLGQSHSKSWGWFLVLLLIVILLVVGYFFFYRHESPKTSEVLLPLKEELIKKSPSGEKSAVTHQPPEKNFPEAIPSIKEETKPSENQTQNSTKEVKQTP